MAISVVLCHRERKYLSSRAYFYVIARNVAISIVFCHCELIFMSSRGTWRSRSYSVIARAAWRSRSYPVIASAAWRSRLFSAGQNSKARLLRRLAMTVILCHREERGDLSCAAQAKTEKRDCFAGYPVIASLFLCHRERSVAISIVFCHREERGDLDHILSSRAYFYVIARNVAISHF